MQKIQSIIFNKNLNTLSYCLKWLQEHDFKFIKVHETTNFYRFRQIDPNILKKQGYNIYNNVLVDENKKIYYVIASKNNIEIEDYITNPKIYNSKVL